MNSNRIFRKTCVLAIFVLNSLIICSNPSVAQKQNCVITDNGATVCGKPIQLSDPSPNRSYRKEFDDFVFTLNGCNRSSDSTVRCKFQINNKGKERGLWIAANVSSIVDSLGVSYLGFTTEIGGRKGNDILTTISPGINYSVVVIFNEIPTRITQVPLLNLKLGADNSSPKLQFRNIDF
jgi:hypothetical protein